MKIQSPQSVMKIAIIVAACVSILLAAPLSARTTVETVPWLSSLVCDGEQIDFEGRARYVVNEEYDGGRLNVFFQFHYKGKGYAQESGIEYVATQNIIESFHDVANDPPLPTVWVLRDYGMLISKGGDGPNYSYKFLAKLIVADGTIVVDSVYVDPVSCVFL